MPTFPAGGQALEAGRPSCVGSIFVHCIHKPTFLLTTWVRIRSLLTEDLRQRRISGRHQISGDGVHLVDGIPFGRRRGPRDRPVLALPPRKRARIAYDSSEEDEERGEFNRLLLEDIPRLNKDADFDGDGESDDDDDSGEDYEELDADDDLEEELQSLEADSGTPQRSGRPSGKRSHGQEEDNRTTAGSQLLKLEGMTPAALVALQAAFPLTPLSTLEAKLDAHGSNLEGTYKDLASANDPSLNYNGMMTIFMETRFNHVSAPEPALLPEAPKGPKPLIQEIEDVQGSRQLSATSAVNTGSDVTYRVVDSNITSGSNESSSESKDDSDQPLARREDDHDHDDTSSSGSDDSDFNDTDDSSEDKANDEYPDGGSPSGFAEMGKGQEDGPNWYSGSSDSESSEDSGGGSMRGMSNGDASVKETKASNPLIQNVTAKVSLDGSSIENATEADSESSGETSDSDGSSSSSGEDAESSTGPDQVSSIFKEAFPDAASSASSNSDSSAGSSKGRMDQAGNKQVRDAQVVFKELEAEQHPVGRGHGLSRTQKRNARRRLAKEKVREQERLGLNADSTTIIGTDKTLANVTTTAETELTAEIASATDQDMALEHIRLSQKRAELSKAIQDAQVASSEESSSPTSTSSSEYSSDSGSGSGPDEEPVTKAQGRRQLEAVQMMDVEKSQGVSSAETPAPTHVDLANTLLPVDGSDIPVPTPGTANSKDEGTRKRMRVDMGAGRRLLFGALGLKNPKNKTDEEKLKRNLMRNVRPHHNHRQDTNEKSAETLLEVEEDSWRDKITYRAVECCYDDMVLSEPPFPFVQRWDPQQQYNSMRKRKRDSQHFEEHYDEESWYGVQDSGSSKRSKKNKTFGAKNQEVQQEECPDEENAELELNYDDPPTKLEAVDTQATDLDDLPSLPTDPNTLPSALRDEVRVGMVVAWRRLQLSKTTNWQPQVQWVTGVVISRDDEKVQLMLAKRDRDQDERAFDEDGNRMYDKFEMPEEGELEEYKPDDGHREMLWNDLTGARLVQGEPSPSMLNSPVGESSDNHDVDLLADQTELRGEPPAPSKDDADSLQMRAGVEGDTAKVADANDEPQDSSSIPSGQNYPFIDISYPVMGEPSNSNASEERSQPSTSDKTARGDSQSQPKGFMSVAKDLQHSGAYPTGINLPLGQIALGERAVAADDEEAAVDVEDGNAHRDGHDRSSASTMHASCKLEDHKEQIPPIDYPQLPVPSSTSSLRSGRQPQYDKASKKKESRNKTPIPRSGPSTLPWDGSPSQKDGFPPEGHSRGSSSDSFPVLGDIWHAAKTSNTQHTPLKSPQGSALGHKNKNLEHGQALSAQHSENEGVLNGNRSSCNAFPNASQPAPERPHSATSAQSPRRSSRRRSQPKSSPFVVPEGSQVITLTSSPASESFDENYADDNLDDTYEDPATSSLPKGEGWVTQKKAGRGRPRRASNR